MNETVTATLANLWRRLYQQSDDVAIHRIETQIQAIEAELLVENERMRSVLEALGDADAMQEIVVRDAASSKPGDPIQQQVIALDLIRWALGERPA